MRTTTRPSSPTRLRTFPSMSQPRYTSGFLQHLNVHCTLYIPSYNSAHGKCFFFFLRNILYVKEAEMKIGLETTLSFLWEVYCSSIFHLLPIFSFSGRTCNGEAWISEQASCLWNPTLRKSPTTLLQAWLRGAPPRSCLSTVAAWRHHRQGHRHHPAPHFCILFPRYFSPCA